MDTDEKAKMLRGERYNCLDPALMAERAEAQRRYARFNQSQSAQERAALLREILGALGEQAQIEPPFVCSYGRQITLGAQSFINAGCVILDNAPVAIGSHVMIGPSVQIYTAAHPLAAAPRIAGWEYARAITLGDRVWIGGGAIILPGVRIGAEAVVAAGAVVSRDVPPSVLVAGNPARIVRQIDQTHSE